MQTAVKWTICALVPVLFLACNGYAGGEVAKYEWLASESAPVGFPMQVISGDFIYADGDGVYVPPNKLIYQGWGVPVSTHLVGEDLKPLPQQLEITYFSYTENKFYKGSFDLPFTRLQKLFAEGYFSHEMSEDITYERITVGVAPGGAVAVWLVGIEKTTEIFFGNAQPVDLDFNLVAGDIDESRETFVANTLNSTLSESELQDLVNHGVPLTRWNRYHQVLYAWDPVFEGFAPKRIGPIKFFNGELDFYDLPLKDPGATRPVPSFLEFKVDRPDKRPLRYLLTFNDMEIYAAFKRLLPAGKPIKLAIIATAKGLSVQLRNEDEGIELVKTNLKTYLGK